MAKSSNSTYATGRLRMVLHSLRVYWAYFVQFIIGRMSYKADFIAALVANVFVTFSGLLFILFLMDGEVVQELNGWRRIEVLFIYAYSLMPSALFMGVAPNLWRFGDKYIVEGQFDRVLLRPLNTLCQVLFESFNLESLGSFLVACGLIGYTASQMGVEFGFIDYFWLFFSAFSAAIILVSVFVILASLSFHFHDRLGIGAPVFRLLNFSRYPLTIFNNVIQFILTWVFPFAFAAFYPATHFLGRREFAYYCYSTPFIALFCLLLASSAWTFGVSRYASTGN